MTEPFSLNKEDKYSNLWKRLSGHIENQISNLRTQNDGDKDAVTTAHLRGRIAALKAILSLNNELPVILPPSDGNQ